jgi:tRNA(Arg) A34 adenosine deaminase TadA
MKHPNKEVMRELISYTKKFTKYGNAVGALLVKRNKVVAKAVATVEKDQDPTSHAELKVISKACRKNKNYHLDDHYLYSTLEPCPMCASAIVWARIKGVVYGVKNKNIFGRLNIHSEKIFKTSPEGIVVHSKFMEKECFELSKESKDEHMSDFFKSKK